MVMSAGHRNSRHITQKAHEKDAHHKWSLMTNTNTLTPNMYKRPLTTTLAAPDRGGGRLPLALIRVQVRDCRSRTLELMGPEVPATPEATGMAGAAAASPPPPPPPLFNVPGIAFIGLFVRLLPREREREGGTDRVLLGARAEKCANSATDRHPFPKVSA